MCMHAVQQCHSLRVPMHISACIIIIKCNISQIIIISYRYSISGNTGTGEDNIPSLVSFVIPIIIIWYKQQFFHHSIAL